MSIVESEYVNCVSGERYYGTTPPSYYYVLTLPCDSSSNYSYVINESLRLFRGAWLTDWEFKQAQIVARLESVSRWMRTTLAPLRKALPRVVLRAIRQPVWSSRRWRSITSKHR